LACSTSNTVYPGTYLARIEIQPGRQGQGIAARSYKILKIRMTASPHLIPQVSTIPSTGILDGRADFGTITRRSAAPALMTLSYWTQRLARASGSVASSISRPVNL
jgi:hypothetical protein